MITGVILWHLLIIGSGNVFKFLVVDDNYFVESLLAIENCFPLLQIHRHGTSSQWMPNYNGDVHHPCHKLFGLAIEYTLDISLSLTLWRHQMETFSALLALHSPVTDEFPAQRLVTRSFDVFFDLRLKQQLSKQWRRRWFETPSRSLWRQCDDFCESH